MRLPVCCPCLLIFKAIDAVLLLLLSLAAATRLFAEPFSTSSSYISGLCVTVLAISTLGLTAFTGVKDFFGGDIATSIQWSLLGLALTNGALWIFVFVKHNTRAVCFPVFGDVCDSGWMRYVTLIILLVSVLLQLAYFGIIKFGQISLLGAGKKLAKKLKRKKKPHKESYSVQKRQRMDRKGQHGDEESETIGFGDWNSASGNSSVGEDSWEEALRPTRRGSQSRYSQHESV